MRVATEDRFTRLLAIVPWVHAQGGATIDETCERFNVKPHELVHDFNLLACVGAPPFTPDMLPLMWISPEENWISVTYPMWYADRLPLTPNEAFLLLTNARTMLSVPGVDPTGPLARALAKIGSVVGLGAVEGLDLSLGDRDPEVVATLRAAADSRHSVEIDYYSLSSDRRSTRTVDPYLVFHDGSGWYVSAFCHSHREMRTFNVGRVHAVRDLDVIFERAPGTPEASAFLRSGDEPIIALDLAPEGAWVIDTYPVESVERLEDGTCRVEMVVANRRLIARLLIRLGPAATVVSAPPGLLGEVKALAGRILSSYAEGETP